MEYRFDVSVTIEEAKKILNRECKVKGTTLLLQVNQHGRIEGDEGKYFPILANVEVSKRTAIKFIEDAYGNLEKRGARIHITALGKCIFIG